MKRTHRSPVVTLTRTIEVTVEIDVEIDGKYVPARTQCDPEFAHPAEYPEASIVEVRAFGAPVDIDAAFTRQEMTDIEDEAIAQIAEDDACRADDAADAKYEAMRDARYDRD